MQQSLRDTDSSACRRENSLQDIAILAILPFDMETFYRLQRTKTSMGGVKQTVEQGR